MIKSKISDSNLGSIENSEHFYTSTNMPNHIILVYLLSMFGNEDEVQVPWP